MTKKERHIFIEWCNRSNTAQETREVKFKEMQQLYANCGGGRPTCSLEYNLKYLLTSENEHTRNRALNIYASYIAAATEYMLILQLGAEMAGA